MRYRTDEGPAHQRIDLIAFGAAVAVSAVLIALPEAPRTAVADALRRSVLRPFVAAHEWAGRRADLRERIDRLQRENVLLERRLLRQEGLAGENRALRDLLSLGLRREGEFVPTDLAIGTPRLGRDGRFVVDAGREDGVEPPAGVVVAAGVVGVVRSATAGRSYGDLWVHPDFRVSVRTDSGGATGIVRPVRPNGESPVMLFEGAPYQRRVPEGTRLVTTGVGGVFPPGVPVGTVRSVSSVESGWARSYRVEPAVRPGSVRSVLVWRRPRQAASSGGGVAGVPGAPEGEASRVGDSTVAPVLESRDAAEGAAPPAPSDSAGDAGDAGAEESGGGP